MIKIKKMRKQTFMTILSMVTGILYTLGLIYYAKLDWLSFIVVYTISVPIIVIINVDVLFPMIKEDTIKQ